MRTFIAIELDEAVRSRVWADCRKLIKLSPDSRWVRPESLHLTLSFIGEIADPQIPEIHALLERTAQSTPAFSIHIRGTGIFGPLDAPKVLWVGFDGDITPLRVLQKKIADGLKSMGIPPDFEVFEPHVTLARSKNPRGDPALVTCADTYRTTSFGNLDAKEVVHFVSHSDKNGMHYTPLSKHELRK